MSQVDKTKAKYQRPKMKDPRTNDPRPLAQNSHPPGYYAYFILIQMYLTPTPAN